MGARHVLLLAAPQQHVAAAVRVQVTPDEAAAALQAASQPRAQRWGPPGLNGFQFGIQQPQLVVLDRNAPANWLQQQLANTGASADAEVNQSLLNMLLGNAPVSRACGARCGTG